MVAALSTCARAARLGAVCAFAAVTATAPDARAWYFPEHVVIAHEGVSQLAPEVRAVLADAIERARAQGVSLCPGVDDGLEESSKQRTLTTRMIRTEVSVSCVPYAVLPALAGDHASSAAELRQVLASQKGIEITSAAAYEWRRFLGALERLPNTSLERMSFVHDLDVAFYFIDPGYDVRAQATRAHFDTAGRKLEDVIHVAATTGNVDNALGQFLAHHVRSMELAARGQVAEAILEHGFAMHFLEDAFAAGHLVMSPETWKQGNEHVRRRHDYYNAKGLDVGRAMSAEPCATLDVRSVELTGLTPCWVTNGDGHLGIWTDASDRLHAARAVAKAEWQFAMALDPERIVAFVVGLGERDQLAIGQLVEPVPWWTVPAFDRRKLRASAARTVMLVRGAALAVERLRKTAATPALVVGGAQLRTVFDPSVLANALDPCRPRSEVEPSLLDASDVTPCGAPRALAIGTIGTSLLRPLLAEWPASQIDTAALDGESKVDLGWALQLLASANAGVLVPPRAPVDFYIPSVAVAAGASYRWGTYLPGRLNRPIGELNVGISAGLHYDSTGKAGGNPQVTMLDQELRWPILWELLASYNLPLDLAKVHGAGHMLFLSGMRVHEVLRAAPVFWGLELEVASFALTAGRGVYPLYAASPELRLYIGAADPSAAQPSFSRAWGPTFGISFTGGYATFL